MVVVGIEHPFENPALTKRGLYTREVESLKEMFSGCVMKRDCSSRSPYLGFESVRSKIVAATNEKRRKSFDHNGNCVNPLKNAEE